MVRASTFALALILILTACGGPESAKSAKSAEPAAPVTPVEPAARSSSGEPACDRYIAALRAAKDCQPQPPDTGAKMDAAIANIEAALRDVPPEKAVARSMIIEGCTSGADEITAALTDLGCRTP